jgi:hypothetical protein
MGGDAAATTLVQAIIRIVAAAHSEDTSQRPICLTCDQAFEHSTPPACFVVFRPERDDPSWVIVNALCARCLGKPASELKRAIMEIWHQTAQPSLRAINLHHTPGHA